MEKSENTDKEDKSANRGLKGWFEDLISALLVGLLVMAIFIVIVILMHFVLKSVFHFSYGIH